MMVRAETITECARGWWIQCLCYLEVARGLAVQRSTFQAVLDTSIWQFNRGSRTAACIST
eukprot:12079678-Alexandrium_andersonii.AAC.1